MCDRHSLNTFQRVKRHCAQLFDSVTRHWPSESLLIDGNQSLPRVEDCELDMKRLSAPVGIFSGHRRWLGLNRPDTSRPKRSIDRQVQG